MRLECAAPKEQSSRRRRCTGGLILLGLLIVMGCALSVPFLYETQTLWYKTGSDRWMLRLGQMAGLLALVLLIVQIVLSLRRTLLELVFGRGALLRWHQRGGLLLAGIATGHVLLVQAPEGFTNLPVGLKYWPEMVGGALFFLLLLTVGLARLRTRLGLDYGQWKRWHGVLGYLLPLMALIHVLFVSESFAGGLPRLVLLLCLATLAVTGAVKQGRNKRVEGVHAHPPQQNPEEKQ